MPQDEAPFSHERFSRSKKRRKRARKIGHFAVKVPFPARKKAHPRWISDDPVIKKENADATKHHPPGMSAGPQAAKPDPPRKIGSRRPTRRSPPSTTHNRATKSCNPREKRFEPRPVRQRPPLPKPHPGTKIPVVAGVGDPGSHSQNSRRPGPGASSRSAFRGAHATRLPVIAPSRSRTLTSSLQIIRDGGELLQAASRSATMSAAMISGAGRLALSSRASSFSQKMSRLILSRLISSS